jgi:hypothetical protein
MNISDMTMIYLSWRVRLIRNQFLISGWLVDWISTVSSSQVWLRLLNTSIFRKTIQRIRVFQNQCVAIRQNTFNIWSCWIRPVIRSMRVQYVCKFRFVRAASNIDRKKCENTLFMTMEKWLLHSFEPLAKLWSWFCGHYLKHKEIYSVMHHYIYYFCATSSGMCLTWWTQWLSLLYGMLNKELKLRGSLQSSL